MIVTFIHSLGFAPLLPRWLLLILTGLCAIAVMAGLAAHIRGTLLRGLAATVVLLWLSGPQTLHETHRDLPETALVIVDQTDSMSIRNRAAISRAAARILGERARDGLALRVVTIHGERTGGTHLFDALSQAAADIPPEQFAGAVMITDGQTQDVPNDIPERLAPRDEHGTIPTLPLHVLLAGHGEETDRRLRILQAPPYAIVGQTASLRVQVDDLGPGTHPGTQATVTLTQDGGDKLEVPVQTGMPQDISLPVSHPGEILVGLSVSALPGEVSTVNNQNVVSINGVRDRLRVLLVSGTPNQGERVWRRLLKADPSVDLVHFTILRPPDKDDGTPMSDLALIAFPVQELFQNKIGQFDLIILDGFENRHILPPVYLRNIARYVRRGGGLFLIAGPEFTGPNSLQDTVVGDVLPAHVPSLAPVDPMESSGGIVVRRFRPQLTDEGRRHPVTAELPGAPPHASVDVPDQLTPAREIPGEWGPWYRALRPDSSHGETLMSGPDKSPLLILDHVDQGRVALLLSDQIWLWSRGEYGGGPQAELLRRISHWLMKEPDLEEERLEARISDGTLTITRHSETAAALPAITVTAPDGAKISLQLHQISPGVSQTQTAAAQPGIWQADDGTHRAFAAPKLTDPQEFADLRLTASHVASVVARTGGEIGWLGDNPDKPEVPALQIGTVPAGTMNSAPVTSGTFSFPQRHAHVLTGTSATPLLPAWLILMLAVLALGSGWYRESR
ncbi:VWA domain-containing protein [Acetobacter fallax]|uniref:VWA domain-containing protein n=1 Tax=Acetobacter fallax TaxID=1737473 RepID=A0ABX0K9D3_9PROT|nr:VWA domain-containing protein [Acetobacter fallax]NHO31155.1 VWA domain-containing protein [Acetobacter fallax]NHO34712.1 VWA domain-containing protein [Acetobacter fallax]